MRLLERKSSLASLAEYAAEARRGEGRLVLVAGEAGVGKSALVERFQRDLPEARWSWGACDGLFTPRPLGPLFDLADQLGGPLLELCRAGAGREELFRGLLREVGDPGVLDVVVMEDVHWADEATLDLLSFLGRRLRGTALLLVATYRDDGLAAADPLRLALGDLASQRSTRRIGLAPLSAEAVRVLAGGSEADASALHRLTGGNPFYVTEVVQAGMHEVPGSARDAVLARAARLSGAAREVLDVAALTGTRVESRLLESVTPCLAPAVDELLACGLVVGDGEWLRFRHEIARLAVEGAVPAHRGRAIHGLVLAALGSLGCDDDARMAFHAEAAGDAAAVLRHAPAAARRAAWLASHREAAAQFRRALRFAAEADATTLAELCEGLADEAALLDQWQDAAEACERALMEWRKAGDRLREGDALRRLSRIMWNMCHGEVAAAEDAVSVLEPLGPGVELAWAYATFANQRMLRYELDAAEGLALRAQALAERLGATDVLSDALNTQAACAGVRGGEWEGGMRRALEIALAGRHQDQAGRAFTNLAALHNGRRQFAEAERYLTEGIAYCAEHDLTTYVTCLRSEESTIMERTGRWEESLAISAGILATVGRSPSNRLCTVRRVGSVLARRGEPGVWEHLDEAAVLADRTGEPQQIVPVRLTRAEAYWLEGKAGEARREAELAHDVAARSDAWDRGAVAVWLLRTGSLRVPQGEFPEPYRLELDGDLAEAARAWTELGCRYDAALALSSAAGEPELRDALRILTGLGAFPAARIVRQGLRRLGVRSLPAGPRAATREHPSGLTRREREVLALVCAQHTNAEIAAKLFISVKTVGHHVSAILAKLGAPSRNAAVGQAVRLGLADA
ncbi:helix-turn-helix transcriptional regulator [Planotetraspora sp. A-T 1434]|uniref:helix-turn-helix transcriptional regulator n=1 Tax=Planotetraspora sp. A-T 1434 TaxID=2979219 RepID=UPI0028FC0B3B|nr:AAA family ATPase [Planotetraspora sp. A-T 1434]